jgi:hypothetical protein
MGQRNDDMERVDPVEHDVQVIAGHGRRRRARSGRRTTVHCARTARHFGRHGAWSSRRGHCYDAFHEIYGVAGSMPVIADSFTDLVVSLLSNAGSHWYWLQPGWISLGDAYD